MRVRAILITLVDVEKSMEYTCPYLKRKSSCLCTIFIKSDTFNTRCLTIFI